MVSAITITYQVKNTLKCSIMQMGPLLGLHLCFWHEPSVSLQQQDVRGSVGYSSLCTEPGKEPSLSPSLPCRNRWFCLQRLRWEWRTQPRWPWLCPRYIGTVGSRLTDWELLLSSSACSAWTDFFWKSMHGMWIWPQIVLGTSSEGSIFIPSVLLLLLHELAAQKLSWSKVCLWILSAAEHL